MELSLFVGISLIVIAILGLLGYCLLFVVVTKHQDMIGLPFYKLLALGE